MTLDVTMTSVIRPDIIKRTLSSFKEKLFGSYPIRLIINVDPVGEEKDYIEVVRVVEGLFPENGKLWRFPEEPSFPKAFIWAWMEAQSEFIFHLEDDWELLHEVDLGGMIGLMTKYPELAVLRLPFTPCIDTNKSWNHFLPWNGEFYEVPETLKGLLGYAGHPSLLSRKFLKMALTLLSDDRNPEKSIKWRSTTRLGILLQEMRYGVYGKPGEPPAIQDIGRGWAEGHGWRKKGTKAFFCVWERIP